MTGARDAGRSGPASEYHAGAALGLPEDGVGSVATMGVRVLAFLLDAVAAGVIAYLFTRPDLPQNWSLLVWALLTVVPVALFGFTPGQAAFGIRVAPVTGARTAGLWAVPRTALIALIVPPLINDRDGRGLHDRWCRTVVIRMR